MRQQTRCRQAVRSAAPAQVLPLPVHRLCRQTWASHGELPCSSPERLELFGDIVAELTQPAATVRTAVAVRLVYDLFALQIFRQWLAFGDGASVPCAENAFGVASACACWSQSSSSSNSSCSSSTTIFSLLLPKIMWRYFSIISFRCSIRSLRVCSSSACSDICLTQVALRALADRRPVRVVTDSVAFFDSDLPRLAIECIEIRQRSVIHGRSMPLDRASASVENPHQYWGILLSSDRDFRGPCSFDTTPVDAFQKHR